MPTIQSLKASQAPRPVTLGIADFSGGYNADDANLPLALTENELADIVNFKYVRTPKGIKLKSREGLSKINATATGYPIYDIFYFENSVYSKTCIVSNSDLSYLNPTTAATKIGDLSSSRGRMCQFNDKLIIADTGVLKYWNGITFSFLSDAEPLIPDMSGYTSASTGFGTDELWGSAVSKAGQAFTILPIGSLTYPLGLMSFVFYVARVGTSATGNITCKIYNDAGTAVLTSTTSTAIGSFSTSYAWVTFNFDDANTLSSNDTYYVVLEGDGTYAGSADTSNHLKVGYITSSTTSNRVYYGGSSWVTPSTTSGSMVYGYYPSQTVAGLGFAPLASIVAQKNDRLYCNHVTYPNRLYYCNANDPNDWSSEDGGGYIVFDGHYSITGIYPFYGDIYVFCDKPRSIYKLSGDGPNEYAVKLLFRDISAVNQDVIQDIKSDLIFLDIQGVFSMRTLLLSGDIEKSIVSRKINNTYILNSNSQFAGSIVVDNQYILQTNSSTSYVFLVYDQDLGTWTKFDFELGSVAYPTSLGIGYLGYTYIGTSDGYVYGYGYPYTQDEGVDFTLSLSTYWHDFGTALVKTCRFVDSLLISVTGETYDLEVYTDMNVTTPKKTLSLVSLSQGGAYHSPYCGNLNELNMNFNQVMFKLANIASGKGPYWLDRIIIEANILNRYT